MQTTRPQSKKPTKQSKTKQKKKKIARRHTGKTLYCERYEIQCPLKDESSATFYGTV